MSYDTGPVCPTESWPDECPDCGSDNIESNPRILSWGCGDCGCDEDSMLMDKADRDIKAVQEGC